MVVELLSAGATHLASGAVVLADNNFGDDSPDATAGPLGLFIVLALLAVTIFLVLNMTKRLKRLPASFDNDDEADAEADVDAAEPLLMDDGKTSGIAGTGASGKLAAPSVAAKNPTRTGARPGNGAAKPSFGKSALSKSSPDQTGR